jgi:cytochrome c oxidase assembly protein Cox11
MPTATHPSSHAILRLLCIKLVYCAYCVPYAAVPHYRCLCKLLELGGSALCRLDAQQRLQPLQWTASVRWVLRGTCYLF